jgi:RNA polymerase sigma-70 factor (ECF subfamily)
VDAGDDRCDEALARRFLAGDAVAFDELVLRHRDAIYRFVRSRLGLSRAEAEDVTQDVLIEVYRCLHRFEGRSRLRSWILGVAANLCRHHRRSVLPGAVREIGPEPLRRLPDGSPGLEAALSRRELQHAVKKAIEGLGAEHRTAVLLRDIEGLSYSEIAEVLQVPLGTVRSRLHNARALLASRLLPLAAEEGCRT